MELRARSHGRRTSQVGGVALVAWALAVGFPLLSWAVAEGASNDFGHDLAIPLALAATCLYILPCFLSGYALFNGWGGALPPILGICFVAPFVVLLGISSIYGLFAALVTAGTGWAFIDGLRG